MSESIQIMAMAMACVLSTCQRHFEVTRDNHSPVTCHGRNVQSRSVLALIDCVWSRRDHNSVIYLLIKKRKLRGQLSLFLTAVTLAVTKKLARTNPDNEPIQPTENIEDATESQPVASSQSVHDITSSLASNLTCIVLKGQV